MIKNSRLRRNELPHRVNSISCRRGTYSLAIGLGSEPVGPLSESDSNSSAALIEQAKRERQQLLDEVERMALPTAERWLDPMA
jgi:hypothetical protein